MVKVQAVVKGVLTRKATLKKYGFEAQWHKKNQLHNYYNPDVREIKRKLPKFNYSPSPKKANKLETIYVKKKLEDDAIYEGEVSEETGLRDGKGTCIWTDGSIYEGYWKDGK